MPKQAAIAARDANYELEALYLDLMELLNEVKQTHLIQEVIDSCKYDGIKEKLLPYRVVPHSAPPP